MTIPKLCRPCNEQFKGEEVCPKCGGPLIPWLSKFVGRPQLPGDEVAFDRINAAFREHLGPGKAWPFPTGSIKHNKD